MQAEPTRGNPLHGWKDGKVSELTTFFHVKPGHEKLMREACHEFVSNGPDGAREARADRIHELRLVLFDNDTRFMWITSFDTDWDPYIDDTLRLIGQQLYGTVFQHTVEAPEGIAWPDLPNQANAIKDMFNNNRETAVGFLSAFKDLTLRELWTDRASARHSRRCWTTRRPRRPCSIRRWRHSSRWRQTEPSGTRYVLPASERQCPTRGGGRPAPGGWDRQSMGPTSDNCCAITGYWAVCRGRARPQSRAPPLDRRRKAAGACC